MRSIAAEADVDAALISYFFGSKRGLFGAVLALAANPDIARLLREMVEREMISRLAERLAETDPAEASAQAAALAVHLTGVIFTRYLLAIEPIASMDPDEVVRRVAPAMHAVLRTPTPPRHLAARLPPGFTTREESSH